MEKSYNSVNGNRPTENGHRTTRSSSYHQSIMASISWLDLKIFYVRITNCEIDDSTPQYLVLNHIPLHGDTLLEVNGVRTSIYSDGMSSHLRRDRLDKKSEEVTFVCTDSIRVTGSVKFEVFDKDVLLLSGVLGLSTSNSCTGESENCGHRWGMNCESDIVAGTGFLKRKSYMGLESASPRIEVYVTGSFDGSPIILTKTVQLSIHKNQMRNGVLNSIPEYESADQDHTANVPRALNLQVSDYPNYKPENEDYNNLYMGREYLDGDDGELSWFSAGVRVGVGIGLSVCLGIGIGVGLLVQTYQGTTRNFRRRFL